MKRCNNLTISQFMRTTAAMCEQVCAEHGFPIHDMDEEDEEDEEEEKEDVRMLCMRCEADDWGGN